MTSALLNGTEIIRIFGDSVPNPLRLEPGLEVHGASIGWANGDYAIVQAVYDTAPENSIETGRTMALVGGVVQITRTWELVAEPEPSSVTNAQARYVLRMTPSNRGGGRTMYDDSNDFIAAAGNGAVIAWEYSNFIHRNGALVQQVIDLGITTSEQMDALFRAADLIEF